MSELIVAVFPDQFSAYEGVHSLEELHDAGNATVFATVVLERNADGTASIKRPVREGPVGVGVGALAGAVIGLFGGPVGAAVGGAVGAAAGRLRDYLHQEQREGFIEVMQRELPPGKFAVLAEISEDMIPVIEARMRALGGDLAHRWRDSVIDYAYEKKAQDDTITLADRKARRASVKAQDKAAKLEDEIADAARELQQTEAKTLYRLDNTKEELEAKLAVLQDQATRAAPDVRRRIERRIAELRQQFAEREAKLRRAHELAQEALHA